jgi:hypothetical protein
LYLITNDHITITKSQIDTQHKTMTKMHNKHFKHDNSEVQLHLICIIGRWCFFIIMATVFIECLLLVDGE